MENDETVCQEADRLVDGSRQADYGHPYFTYSVCAEFWTTLLRSKGKLHAALTAEDVVQCLQLMKIQREAFRPKRDNRVDLAGYAKVLDMVVNPPPEVVDGFQL